MNKLLRGALVSAVVFSVLNELLILIDRYVILLITRSMGADLYQWTHTIYSVEDVLFFCVQLSFVVAGIALIAANRKSVPALIGGAVLSVRGLMLSVQIVLWRVFEFAGNLDAQGMVYSRTSSLIQLALIAVAYVLIALHYDSKAMLWVGIAMIVLKAVIQVLYVCPQYHLLSTVPYVILAGSCSFAIFVVGLIYLICWLRKTSQK